MFGTQAVVLIVFLICWQLASGTLIHELMISKPSNVFPLFWKWVTDGTIFTAAGVTFTNAFLGLIIGGAAGITVGVFLGQSSWLADIFEPFITAIYTMPKHALIPLFIMWVGIGSQLSVLTSAVIVFFLIFFNTFFGIREVKASLISAVRIMGGSAFDVLWRVRLPSALVWVVAALKLAVPQAIVGVVVAEMLAGNSGLGFLVSKNAHSFNAAGTYAALLALLVAGFLVDRLMTFLTKKPLEWKNSGSAM
ncbi:ABC transporter permease [Salinibacterium sp. ZJ450]|uniref:ABC transporter permease n=1 Tax=Salinibacterium sp. ZJ450 TaxID=2708338 RepID=UPI001CD2D7E7|nr:ABC transporter permease subunit [Salinibacterium sp. ZJ450]